MENCETPMKVALNGALRELEKEMIRIRAEIEIAKDPDRLRTFVTRIMTIIITTDDLAAQPESCRTRLMRYFLNFDRSFAN
jgi:hypothetical protein